MVAIQSGSHGLDRKESKMSTEKRINAPSGWVMLFVTIVAYLASCGLLVAAIIALGSASSQTPTQ